MRKDYQKAYANLKKFSKKVDNLGIEERKIHKEIQQLEDLYKENPKKYQKKFVPLRLKVFYNLRVGEKMLYEENRLKSEFRRKVNNYITRKKIFKKLIE